MRENQLPVSAAEWQHGSQCRVAAWFPDMCCNFYLMKNHKIVKTSMATKAREKISTDIESLEF
jgi:hypothetical protein